MRKLSLKWKLFLVFSYIQLVTSGLVLFVLIFSFSRYKYPHTSIDLLIFFLVALALLLVCLNMFLNIHAVHRYFPDTLLPRRNKVWMKTAGVIMIFLWAGLLFLCIIGMESEFSAEVKSRDHTGLIVLSVLSFLWMTGVYTLIFQFQVFHFLARNHEAGMHNLINLIGTE